MRSFFALKLTLCGIVVFGLACATSQRPVPQVTDEKFGGGDGRGIVEDLEPRSLNDDEWDYAAMAAERQRVMSERRHRVTVVSDVVPALTETVVSDSENAGGHEMIAGYRVQVCAVRGGLQARKVLQQAQDIFAAYPGYQVYLTYDSPYYKVRIGDCRLPYQADRVLNICQENGLDKAWVVKTRIYRNVKLYDIDNFGGYLPDSTRSDK